MFVGFVQNNSGGYFIINEDAGIGHYIIVEGTDIVDIRRRAENIVEDFSEYCSCCGKRWDVSLIFHDDLYEYPNVYGKPVKEFADETNSNIKNMYVFIHYIDGRIERFYKHTESGVL